MVSKSPKRPQRPGAPQRADRLPPPGLLASPEEVIQYYSTTGLNMDPAVGIEQIIQSNDELILTFKDLGGNDAYIKKISDERFEIAVNSNHHPNRQKFSMAHEYAHYLLHRSRIHEMPEGERILHRNGDRNSIEYQANDFAAQLLMPHDLVRSAFRAEGGNLKNMASRLQVSQEALRYRLDNLGYRIS